MFAPWSPFGGFLNVKVGFDEENKTIALDATDELSYEAPFKYVSKMRASIVVLGPLLARLGRAKVAMPGYSSENYYIYLNQIW